jgi:hypothetical protein
MSGGPEVQLRHLLGEDLGLLLREAAAAVLARPVGAVQPRSAITASQRRTSSGYAVLLPPQQTSSGLFGGVDMDAGALALEPAAHVRSERPRDRPSRDA